MIKLYSKPRLRGYYFYSYTNIFMYIEEGIECDGYCSLGGHSIILKITHEMYRGMIEDILNKLIK
jgi:hypothetical protein